MSRYEDEIDPRPWPKNGLWFGVLIAGLVGVLLVGTTLAASGSSRWLASGSSHWLGHGHGHRGHFGAHDPETAREHTQQAAEWVLRYVDASDEQRAQINAIIERSVDDLFALADEHRGHREAVAELFRQPTIDRGALDDIRRAELELADGASQHLLGALADAAEVLTPEQREELYELAERFHR